MLSNRLAFAALAVACIGAAAGGGYLATRQNAVPTPASAQAQQDVPAVAAAPAAATATAPAATAAPAKALRDAEPVVADTPRKPAAATKASASRPMETATHPSPSHDDRAATSAAAHRETATLIAGNNNAQTQPPAPLPPAVETVPPAPRPEEHAVQEPVRPPEPPARTFTELVVSADSVIGLQTDSRVSSETARVEDRVEARVTRDVKVGDRVAIPAGAKAIGSVMQVERGGKFKERARLGIRFNAIVLADGTRIPISTETIFREGDAPSTAPRVGGGAVAGTILGAILGGGKGAAIGAAAGAGAGAATIAAGDRNAATLAAGTSMTVRILQPVTITTDNKE
jgi:type IV secretory pathway VirB10-like protein